MRIEVERWQAAQTEEFSHHQDLRLEAYSTASKIIAKYLEFDYETDFKDKGKKNLHSNDNASENKKKDLKKK